MAKETDRAPLVARGCASFANGKWLACIRFTRDSEGVAEGLVFENEPQDSFMAALVLARRYARRINAGEAPDKIGAGARRV